MSVIHLNRFPLIDGPLVYRQPLAARGSNFLLDGPDHLAPARAAEILGRMADHLVEREAYGSDQDAIRMLHRLGYRSLDVALLAPKARDLARQFVETQAMVAREILDNAT